MLLMRQYITHLKSLPTANVKKLLSVLFLYPCYRRGRRRKDDKSPRLPKRR